jgi:hypothetical protein
MDAAARHDPAFSRVEGEGFAVEDGRAQGLFFKGEMGEQMRQ